ncbi:hypothetical protein L3X38_040643 [Prunus dulcis]|uniref:Integrase catalytic domain-containing protein n=1 Tax=Prunus dulcis TaxID=3755 RepID=A0AAD4YTK8_PRUDU|nr:hypothetical protein L3X38_040643 [Prunus dulcis]
MPKDCVQRIIKIGRKSLPSVLTRGMEIEVNSALITKDDWREPIMTYLQYPTLPSEKRVRIMATNYLMWNEDLVRKSKDEVLLRCLGKTEYMKVMGETHEGIYGAHQGGRKMCWLIRRYGYFWPTMLKDCINYSKGCEACQRHGPIQQAPSVPMNPVVKPWPFRGWAMDLIGKIYPASSQQHCFIIVATDYFTKWVEAKPIKTTTSQEIITFIEEQIIQRFGIPESITTDRGSSFISRDMLDMAETFKFKLLQSTPYYAQANGQAESSNKVIINIIRKMLEKNPKQWHEKLSETLWAYRTSKREATGMTPYALTYGHDAILPKEIAVQSLRIAHQHGLTGEDYSQAMLLELEKLDASRIDTLNKLLAGKQAVINRPAMRPEPKDLSHIQQGWRHKTHTEVKCITGRIPETQSSGEQVLISVNRLLGQENGVISPRSPPVTPISREKSVNPVCPFDRTVPHLAGWERPAQILANPRIRSQGRSTFKIQRSLRILFQQFCHPRRNRTKPMRP